MISILSDDSDFHHSAIEALNKKAMSKESRQPDGNGRQQIAGPNAGGQGDPRGDEVGIGKRNLPVASRNKTAGSVMAVRTAGGMNVREASIQAAIRIRSARANRNSGCRK